MKNLKTVYAIRSIGPQMEPSNLPDPLRPPTQRASAHTAETWTVHRTTRRRTRKNPQRNTRQTNPHRKQTQDNRRTTQAEEIVSADHTRREDGFLSALARSNGSSRI